MKSSFFTCILLAVFLLGNMPGSSQAALYNIAWTGDNGYSMRGQVVISDFATGIVNESHVENLTIEGFDSLGSIGTWSLNEARQSGQASYFNFNFDMDTQSFLTGGRSDGVQGQFWSNPLNANDFGFTSANIQALVVDGKLVFESRNTLRLALLPDFRGTSTLTATQIANPIPSSILLFATGFVGLIAFRNYRQRETNSNV